MFAKVVKKSNYMFKREKKEKKFLGKLTTFFVFKHNNFSLIWQKMINNVDKTAFDVSKELNWGKRMSFFRKKCSNGVFSDYEIIFAGFSQTVWSFRRGCQRFFSNKFQTFGKQSSGGLWQLNSTCQVLQVFFLKEGRPFQFWTLG